MLDQPETRKIVQQQDDAYNGKRGAILLAVNRTNGEMTEGLKLHTTPVFDGLVSGYNRLFISMSDGSVVCLGSEGEACDTLSAEGIAAYNADAKITHPRPKAKKKK